MKIAMACLVACATLMGVGQVSAAFGSDPTWPCVQRKQPHLSLGQVWTGPQPDESITKLSRDPKIERLAARLEQRRLPLEEAAAQITDFAKDNTSQDLTALMAAIFQRVESDRSALIEGIARYGEKQVALSQMIEDRRKKMSTLEAAETPDFDAIDAEEKALDWDQRIFTERRQSLSYVCETPVLLEQRLFALGREIAGHLDR